MNRAEHCGLRQITDSLLTDVTLRLHPCTVHARWTVGLGPGEQEIAIDATPARHGVSSEYL